MPGTKSISEVRDLYDLIELYGSLDKNADGLLGAGEVSAEEIAAGDRGGIGSANADVKDGFLSPWEVAQMRGFKWEDVRPLRIANQIHHTAFNDIKSLSKHVELGDIVFKTGAPLLFHSNGVVREGVTAQAMTFNSVPLPAGTRLSFNSAGRLASAILVEPISYRKIAMPIGTKIEFGETPLFISSEENAFSNDGIHYIEIAYDGPVSHRKLAKDSMFPIFKSGNETIYAHLSKGDDLILIDENEVRFSGVNLNSETALLGFSCAKGSIIQFDPALHAIFLKGDIRQSGIRFQEIVIDTRSLQRGGILTEDTVVMIGNRPYKFAAHRYVAFTPENMIVQATLAEAVESPYGTGVFPAGSDVAFSDDGRLLEGSMACFHTLFPGISLTGEATPKDIVHIMKSLKELPRKVIASIREIHLASKNEEDSAEYKYEDGHADQDGHTITLQKGRWKGDPNYFEHFALILHEAAHIFTFEQEERSSKFSDRWKQIVAGVDGDVYGKDIELASDKTIMTHWTSKDQSASDQGPRNGCVSAYGCQNLYEDVATHVRTIVSDPGLYRELIDPDSKFYENDKDQKKYAPVYRAKLELLHEYGFITDAKYREIVPEEPKQKHQDIANFCAREAVNCPQ